jgi:hypothetical protein
VLSPAGNHGALQSYLEHRYNRERVGVPENPNPSIKSGISVENFQLEEGRETLKGKRIPTKVLPSIFPTGRERSTLASSLTGIPAQPPMNKAINKTIMKFLFIDHSFLFNLNLGAAGFRYFIS